MELVIRGLIIYVFLFLIMRAAGNRQFSQLTAFDAVLLLIIAEATQQALVGEDASVTSALVLIVTIVGIDIILSQIKKRSKQADLIMDGVPVLLMDEGQIVHENLDKERVDEEDILVAARQHHGLEALDQIKYAVLERDGTISIVPRK